MSFLRAAPATPTESYSFTTRWRAQYRTTPRGWQIARLVVLVALGMALVGGSLAAVLIAVTLRFHGHV